MPRQRLNNLDLQGGLTFPQLRKQMKQLMLDYKRRRIVVEDKLTAGMNINDAVRTYITWHQLSRAASHNRNFPGKMLLIFQGPECVCLAIYNALEGHSD